MAMYNLYLYFICLLILKSGKNCCKIVYLDQKLCLYTWIIALKSWKITLPGLTIPVSFTSYCCCLITKLSPILQLRRL